MKTIRVLSLSLIICLMLPFVVGFTGTPSAGCSTQNAAEQIKQYAPDVIDLSREVVSIIKSAHPEKVPQADEYLRLAEDFYQKWQQDQLSGLAVVPLLLNSFNSNIRANLDPKNTALQIAAAGLDFALRKFARYWQQKKDQIQASPADLIVAKGAARAKGVDLASEDQKVESFLKMPKIEKPKQ